MNEIWNVLAALIYAIAAFLLLRDLDRSQGRAPAAVVALLLIGAGCHAFALATELFGGPTVNLGLGTAMSVASWVVMVLYLIALARQPLATLGLIVIPYVIIDVVLTTFWTGPPMPLAHLGPRAIAHTLISVVAFGLLALAFCLAVVLLLQEWHLQNKRQGSFFHSLPALQTMERVLFQIIGIGFTLLTIALVSGVLFSNELFGRPFLFNHHVVLSIIAWVCFGGLLAGRAIRGLRGRAASIWTIVSFFVLTLGYFGTRFVLEILLNRH
jgi:ABC-type uncharacterized transport system permease subunit